MSDLKTIRKMFNDSIDAKKVFSADENNLSDIKAASGKIVCTYQRGGKVLVCGNGGSAADSQHMAAELAVRFEAERKALPCIALSVNTSTITAAANDYDFSMIFARQVEALALSGDVLVAISTSGNSSNVIKAVSAAKKSGVYVIGLLGMDGGKLEDMVDLPIVVRAGNTARVQEVHIVIIHILCKLIEESIKGE